MLRLDATFDEIDLMCESVRAWNLDFRPLANGGTSPRIGRLVQLEAGGSLFGHARVYAPLQQTGAPPPGLVTFAIQERGMQGLWWRGHDVDADTVLAFPIGGELNSISGADFDIHTMSVSEETLARAAVALELEVPKQGWLAEVFPAPKEVLGPVRLQLRWLRDGATAALPSHVMQILLALLPYWLKHARHGLRARPAPKARARAIRMSLELMEAEPLDALNPAHLSTHSGVSERTLQYAFLDRFGLTPAAFVKARRLASASAALKSHNGPHTSVGDIAAQFGFWHSGQFAADYKRAFGELPSDTLSRPRT